MSINSTQRIEDRCSMRNLDYFLEYDFNSGKKLGLVDSQVYHAAVQVLQSIDTKSLGWQEAFGLWWKGTTSLKKITQYVSNHAQGWEKALSEDSKSLIQLERQCALLEQKVIKHNLKLVQNGNQSHLIPYSSPLRKTLRVVVKYPKMLGDTSFTSTTYDLTYHRLFSLHDLTRKFQEILLRPVAIQVGCTVGASGKTRSTFAFPAAPKQIFNQVTQEPTELFDPSEEVLRPKLTTVTVTYQDHDWNAVAMRLFLLGQKQAMPRVYQQGFADGQKRGFEDASSRIKESLIQSSLLVSS